jgi:hypothetical protein
MNLSMGYTTPFGLSLSKPSLSLPKGSLRRTLRLGAFVKALLSTVEGLSPLLRANGAEVHR